MELIMQGTGIKRRQVPTLCAYLVGSPVNTPLVLVYARSCQNDLIPRSQTPVPPGLRNPKP